MSMAEVRLSDSDPRRLRELFSRTGSLACEHAVPSVIVGLAGREEDAIFPELVGFIESALRVEDSIFRMTRERAVLFVSDVDRSQAQQIVERLLQGFHERFSLARDLDVRLGYYEVSAGAGEVSAKRVLPAVFQSNSGSS
jgi:hypothetical protein